MNFKICIFILTGMLTGCITSSKTEVISSKNKIAELSEDNSDIQPPTLEKEPVITLAPELELKKGDQFFNEKKYEEAILKYKNVVEFHKLARGGLAAQALFKIGMSYELMGNTSKAVATYLDALRRKKDLSFELSELEIPARLAMSYLRMGQLKAAKPYFIKAEKGMALLRDRLPDYQQKVTWLAEILYGMGYISSQVKDDKNFEETIYSIKHAQNYLLLCLELNDSQWSPKAAEELLSLYNVSIDNILNLVAPENKDPVVAERLRQEKQVKMAYTLLDQIENFQDQIVPGTENKFLNQALEGLIKTEKKLSTIISSRPAGEGLTKEAKKFEKLKREGRIKDE